MPELAEVSLHGNVAALHIRDRVDKREVVAEGLAERIVGEEDGVVDGFLQRLNILGIEIVALVVPERPHHRHIRVGVAQAEEIISAYPPRIVVVLALQRVDEEGRAHPVQIVDVDVLILAHHQCGMAHGAAAAEQIHEVALAWQEAHNALRQLVFTSFVR